MVETAKKLDSKTIVECKDLEVIEGDLKNHLWIMQTDNDIKVVLDVDEYVQVMKLNENLLKENFELKLERAILSQFPIDYDDVKAVVLKEMKKHNDKDLEGIIDQIKLEHPNLFYSLDVDKLF